MMSYTITVTLYTVSLLSFQIGVDDKKAAIASNIPPPKPPRRTSSVIMKKPTTSPTMTATNDPGHEYEVIH